MNSQIFYMGVRGLLTYLSPIQKPVELNLCKRWSIGVDVMYILYFFRDDKAALEQYIKTLLLQELQLTFVLDGKADEEKKDCLAKRRAVRSKAAEDVEQLQADLQSDTLNQDEREILEQRLRTKESEAWQLSHKHKQWFLDFVKGLGCSVILATKEADTLLASPLYNAVISADTDILVIGCKRMWIPIRNVTGILHKEYDADDMWKVLGLDTRHQLLELAFLAGCDVQTKPILPFDKALSHVRFYGSLFHIHITHPEIVSEELLKKFVALCRGVWATI